MGSQRVGTTERLTLTTYSAHRRSLLLPVTNGTWCAMAGPEFPRLPAQFSPGGFYRAQHHLPASCLGVAMSLRPGPRRQLHLPEKTGAILSTVSLNTGFVNEVTNHRCVLSTFDELYPRHTLSHLILNSPQRAVLNPSFKVRKLRLREIKSSAHRFEAHVPVFPLKPP